jgi:MFS transporter, ACS family, tartrate transporter
MDDIIEKSAMRKIYLRLLPFAILSYFLAYIDRINVSFAALTMRDDLGISAGPTGLPWARSIGAISSSRCPAT